MPPLRSFPGGPVLLAVVNFEKHVGALSHKRLTETLPEHLARMLLKLPRLSQFIIELGRASYSGKSGVSLQGAG